MYVLDFLVMDFDITDIGIFCIFSMLGGVDNLILISRGEGWMTADLGRNGILSSMSKAGAKEMRAR